MRDHEGNCPECEAKLVRRDGKYGPFAGCSGYPGCRYTSDLDEAVTLASGVTEADVDAHARRFEDLKARAWRSFKGR